MQKDVTVVTNHHEVLEAWSRTSGLHVVTLDYHTDSNSAFLMHSQREASKQLTHGNHKAHSVEEEIVEGEIQSYLRTRDIRRAISLLSNDEHIDFAVRTGIINRSFALTHYNGGNYTSNKNVYSIEQRHPKYDHQKIVEYCPTCIPGCQKVPHDNDCEVDRARNAIDDLVLAEAIGKFKAFEPLLLDNFILDIDCDYFRSVESLSPPNVSVFEDLIKRSALITIALEPGWVTWLRFHGEEISSDMICESLIRMIRRL